MAEVIYPPNRLNNYNGLTTLFLGGSIDMGKAIDWQTEVIQKLNQFPITVFNPRRMDWDSSWEQDITNKPFREQVEWELFHLEMADTVFFFFDPAGKSPITLMELGLLASKNVSIVVCPNGFWRRGNVQIVCRNYKIPFFNTIDDGIDNLKLKFSQRFRN